MKYSRLLFINTKREWQWGLRCYTGVSGGTIAFITGIYEELINSIKSINGNALKLLFAGKFVELWKSVNGNFLLSVLIGIGISILSLAKGLNIC